MKVIILAAGRGTRLGKLTESTPKCMLEFGNETILERQIRILQSCGIGLENIIIVTGYKKECIEKRFQVCCITNNEYNITDNSYSLYLALKDILEDALVLDGDLVFYEAGLRELIHTSRNTMLVNTGRNEYGATGIQYEDDSLHVTAIGKHITSDITYSGMMKITANSLEEFVTELSKKRNKTTWYTVPLNRLLDRIDFRILISENAVLGINSYFEYIEAKRIFKLEDYTILVTRASSFLGKKIYHILKRDYNVKGISDRNSTMDLPEIDMTDEHVINAYLELMHPKVIIHSGVLVHSDMIKEDLELAYDVNIRITYKLTNICKKKNIKLIYISSDDEYGFESGKINTDKFLCIRSNACKAARCQAEAIVREYENSLVVGIPSIYGYNDEDDEETFPLMVLKKLWNRRRLFLDNRQKRYHVLIDEVALVLSKSLAKTGLMQITTDQPVTNYEWGKIIAEESKLDSSLILESLENERRYSAKLELTDKDCIVSDVRTGTKILIKQRGCAFKLIYKSSPLETIYGKNIGKYRYELGKRMGYVLPKRIIDQLDCVVPVPTSGIYYALGMAEAAKIPYIQGLVKPDVQSRSFQIADITLREQMIRTKIFPIEELLNGKNIALVDEAIFTGTTLRVVCDMVKACGVNKIFICLPTPICRNRCSQYVQPDRELLADLLEENEFKNYFRVEEVFFQPYDNFSFSVSDVDNICYECFSKKEEE